MSTKLNEPVGAKWLSEQLGLPLLGEDRPIAEISVLAELKPGSLSFLLRGRLPEGLPPGTVFASPAVACDGVAVIASAKPRLAFIKAQHILEARPGFVPVTEPPRLHPTVTVGPHTTIENGVVIGEGTRVGACVVICSRTTIGRFCEIKSGAVIGEPGFGFERDEEGRPIKMIHLGGVRLGDHVEVGALTTVARGALGLTVLGDWVKTDDHVHISHNCSIGEGTLITAGASLSGSVVVGKNAWLAPRCAIIQKVRIGDGAFVGIGAVVLRDVPAGAKVFGVPARELPALAE